MPSPERTEIAEYRGEIYDALDQRRRDGIGGSMTEDYPLVKQMRYVLATGAPLQAFDKKRSWHGEVLYFGLTLDREAWEVRFIDKYGVCNTSLVKDCTFIWPYQEGNLTRYHELSWQKSRK